MRRLGKILHVSQTTGNFIVKAQSEARIGEKVFDSKLHEVGYVFDFFGPVSAPYASVKPNLSNPHRLVGQVLYLVGGEKGRK
jgi:rRNA processing protein Gar1